MAGGDQAIRALREALRHSPDNLPLHQHLAETLLGHGQPEEAEKEFRAALARWPDDESLKIGLAGAFYQQGKDSHALVLIEELNRGPNAPPRAALLHARLLLRAGDLRNAAAQYRKAVSDDPNLADPDLAARLDITPTADDAPGDEVVEGRVRATWQEGGDAPDVEVERPRINFNDVGGMEPIKDEIRMKIIHPLAHPELYKAYGKAVGGGILLYGPPGCGKTHLARATAGEIRAGFLAVGINDVLNMWLGNSEKNLHELFEQARNNTPCVLFFDEVDALAASRSDLRASAGRQLVNQFLAETDGIQRSNEGVLVLAATNAPWHLDAAFRRPGRFDRIVFVPPPDVPARAAILRILCRGKPVQDVDYDHLAKKTDAFSGADLKAVVDVAVESKLREAMKAGVPKPLTTKDLAAAAGTIKPSTREWFATARNYALYSNQGGIYDDILKHLKL
jgi:AAA+ superfamily predicted ATPase/thioredoxin-like negative regulator of GroEL